MYIFQLPEDIEKRTFNSGAFGSNRWIARQKDFWTQAKNGVMPRFSELPLVVENVKPNLVIDFGGGSGWISQLCDIDNYIVIESSLFLENYPLDTEISIMTLSDFMQRYRQNSEQNVLLYTNSAIQYLTEISTFTSLIEFIKPKHILFDDLVISNGDKIVLYQNYYGDFIPYYVHTADELIGSLESKGYEIIHAHDYGDLALKDRIIGEIKSLVEEANLSGPQSLLLGF